MQFKKRRKGFVLAMVIALVCLTTNCWAFDVPILDYSTVNSSNRQFATGIDESSFERKLVFNWNGTDNSRIRVWSNNSTINTALRARQLKEALLNFGDLPAEIDGNGRLELKIEALIMEVTILYAIDAEDVIEAVVDGATMAVLVQIVNWAYRDGLRSASALKDFLLRYENLHDILDINEFVDDVLLQMPDIPQLIKDNLFVYQIEGPIMGGITDPCDNVVDDFVCGQVYQHLIDPTWDPICICRGSNLLVERYRDSATCKLIPNRSYSDGQVFVYERYCGIKGYSLSEAVDFDEGGDPNNPPYDESTDNTPNPNSHDSGGSDLSISNCYLSIAGKDDWKHQINKTLTYEQSFQIEAEGRVRNESDFEAKNVDWDWRVDGGKKNFDRDDKKLDEDTVDIDPNSKVKKHMGRSTIKLSSDGKTVTITGPKGSKSFPVKDGKCKVYIFIDVENDDDDDISSRDSSKHEYGVVEITVQKPPLTPKQKVAVVQILMEFFM